MKKIIVGAFALATLMACNQKEQHNEPKEQIQLQQCGYVINNTDSSIGWNAYKTTEKVGVGGEFFVFDFVPNQSNSASVQELFTNLNFNIDVKTVNTKNEERDKKILEHFFGTLTKKQPITGTVKSFKNRKAIVAIHMNNTVQDVELNYTQEGNIVNFTGTIDVTSWQGAPAIKALNDVCYELHKGADGKSKLWNEVDISIKAVIEQKEC